MADAQILSTTWKRKKHISTVEAAMSSSRAIHFFKADHSDESLLLAVENATFVYPVAIYGPSFKSSD